MKVGILSSSITLGSGESRFAVNMAEGLRAEGINTALFAYTCDIQSKFELSSKGIEVHSSKAELNSLDRYRLISDSKKVFFEILKMINSVEVCDYYVVLSDNLMGISEFRTNAKWIYLSNGDIIFLYLNGQFLENNSPYARILSKRFVSQSLNHQRCVKKYDILLANSQFTASIMSFFLNSIFADYVYPPVDTEKFKPNRTNNSNPYALVLLRSNAEPLAKYITALSKKIPIRIVGNVNIEGAVTLGRLSDDELISAYSNATLTITASLQEFFGYSTAESLSCGTPVISFNHGGAAELIKDGFNGWLVNSERALFEISYKILREGYDENMRENARISSAKYSISGSTRKLTNILKIFEKNS